MRANYLDMMIKAAASPGRLKSFPSTETENGVFRLRKYETSY